MPVVDLQIVKTPSASGFADQFEVKMTFEHDDDSITETETAVFGGGQKADVIEFVNTLLAANEYISEHCSEPEDDEVENYQKWCDYSNPGLNGWPSDSNGNYFAELSNVTVAYYDANGTRFEVTQVKDD